MLISVFWIISFSFDFSIKIGLKFIRIANFISYMGSNDNVDSHWSVVTDSYPQNKKLSHICIFDDCQKGKRGGGDFCNKHRFLAEGSIENLEGKMVAENKIAADKKIINSQIISIPRPITNEIHFNESNNDEEDEQISVKVSPRNYDKESLTTRDVISFILMAFAAFSLFNAFEYGNGEWLYGCLIFYFAGLVLIATSSRGGMHKLLLVVFYIVIFYLQLELLAQNMTFGGSMGDPGGWGGP